jgi:hypothetical protein
MNEHTKKALQNFEQIKQGLQGICEILKINYTEDNFYYLMAQDNIRAIYGSLLQLFTNEEGTRELIERIKSAEIDLDIFLDNLI